ncbi:MAG: mechanosensitive ion channel domain-containing protein [Candidatus Nanoarchaeia archaeon]
MQALNQTETLRNISSLIEPFYSSIIISAIILLSGFVLGRILGRLLFKVLSEIELNKIFKLATGLNIKIDNILSKVVTYFIYFIFIMWALETLGLSLIIINILAGGVIILFIIAIVLGIKDFIPNIIAGVFIHIRGIVKEGDKVELDSIKGTVENVGLVETKLSSSSKDVLFVPNSVFIKTHAIKIKKQKNI